MSKTVADTSPPPSPQKHKKKKDLIKPMKGEVQTASVSHEEHIDKRILILLQIVFLKLVNLFTYLSIYLFTLNHLSAQRKGSVMRMYVFVPK